MKRFAILRGNDLFWPNLNQLWCLQDFWELWTLVCNKFLSALIEGLVGKTFQYHARVLLSKLCISCSLRILSGSLMKEGCLDNFKMIHQNLWIVQGLVLSGALKDNLALSITLVWFLQETNSHCGYPMMALRSLRIR